MLKSAFCPNLQSEHHQTCDKLSVSADGARGVRKNGLILDIMAV